MEIKKSVEAAKVNALRKERQVWVVWAFLGYHAAEIMGDRPVSQLNYCRICSVEQVRRLAVWRLEKLDNLISADKALTSKGVFCKEVRELLSPLIKRCRSKVKTLKRSG